MRPALLALALVLTSCQTEPAEQEAGPPNFLLVITDDQGWGDLGLHGNTNLSTPNLDLLAKEGAQFGQFFVQPVCSPTRAELLTGRYHPRASVYSTTAGGERIDLDEVTVAQYLKEAGYVTGAFGKWHSGSQPPYHPNSRGFDEYYGFTSGHWGDYFDPPIDHNGTPTQGTGYLTDDLTTKTIEFIKENRKSPFFAYLAMNTPHSPMQVPDEYWDRHKDSPLELRHPNTERQDLEHTKAAMAMVENIDWNMGRLTAFLDEFGLTDNTVVLFMSDNGPNGARWNGGLRGTKGSADDGGVRSPLFVRWPGHIGAGTEIPEIAGAIDLLPTLLDLADVDLAPRNPLDGTSLKALLLGEPTPWPDRMLVSSWRRGTSIRSQDYRLDIEGRLYDMRSDPGQTLDIGDAASSVREELVAYRDQWERDVLSERPEVDDRPFPIGYPGTLTQMPIRDAISTGGIERSNRYPNDSYFRNWTSTEDQITWNAEVLESGTYEVEMFYTCPEGQTGSTIELSFNGATRSATISDAHDPPEAGMEDDRIPRQESYVKDFRAMSLGTIELEKGRGTLMLRATEIPGDVVADVRLVTLRRR